MRYRRLKYRYAMVLTRGAPPMPTPDWRSGRLGVVIAQPHWRPTADVYETANAVHVIVDLAGVAPEDLEALLYEDAVVICGERRVPPTDEPGFYHTAEIRQGPFRLELPLPAAVDPERVEGGYDQGLLRLTLAKADGR
ncbi:MAG TPA: Hsp20/alpha crystallin family protein [Chloroflexota bacterium]|jgi:HSP20 family protein